MHDEAVDNAGAEARALPRSSTHHRDVAAEGAGVPLATVQKILRHRDPRTTAQIYGHLDIDDMRSGLGRSGVQGLGGLAPAVSLSLAISLSVN